MTWRLAKSLVTLRDQVNAKWPNRDKSSDGTIGDAAHQATDSDHNPNSAGVVTAMDITHDPAHGLDARKLAETLVASRDPRIKYIISNAQIISSVVSPWQWRTYTGSNAHRKHVHISVTGSAGLYDDTRPWNLGTVAPPSGRFAVCLPRVLKHEGGNVDDPRDTGGRTSRGITAARWAEWRQTHPGLPEDVWEAPQAEVEAIYREKYWDVLQCDRLPVGIDYAVFDWGVNSGTGRPIPYLQKLVGVEADGIIGPKTLAAIASRDPAIVISGLCDERMVYLKGRPNWETYKNGWTSRVSDVRRDALADAKDAPVPVPVPIPDKPKTLAEAIANVQAHIDAMQSALTELKEQIRMTQQPAPQFDLAALLANPVVKELLGKLLPTLLPFIIQLLPQLLPLLLKGMGQSKPATSNPAVIGAGAGGIGAIIGALATAFFGGK
jgi:lysozyme family protein